MKITAFFGYHEKMTTQTVSEPQTPPVIGEYIAIKPGFCGGKPHIDGRRIKVQHVAVWHERMGMTPEPTISLPAVHAALAYYYGHRAEIDSDIVEDEHFAAAMKAGPSNGNGDIFRKCATRPR